MKHPAPSFPFPVRKRQLVAVLKVIVSSFLNIAKSMKEKLDKLNFTKTENFCFVEDTVKRMKSQAIEKVFAKYLSDKDWYSKYIKNP